MMLSISACRGKVSSNGQSAADKSLAIEKVMPEIISYKTGDEVALKAVLSFRTIAQNVSDSAKWSVADESICVLIDGATLEGQRVHIKSIGECSVSAAFEEFNASIVLPVATPETATVDGTTPTIELIAIKKDVSSLPLGTKGVFKAEATFSDGTSKDVTEHVVWSSASANTIVQSIVAEKGKFLAKTLGQDIVIATAENGVAATASIEVTAAALVSISVVTENVQTLIASLQLFKAFGTYSDESIHQITDLVTWTSSNTGVLTISSSQGHWGEGAIVAAGNSVISAALAGKTGIYNVSVTSAVPVALEITPDGLSLPVGVSQQLSAIVTYSDGSKLDMTSAVTWSLVDNSDAAISGGLDANASLNITDKKGWVQGLDTSSGTPGDINLDGKIRVRAVLPGYGVVADSMNISISTATLRVIRLTPNVQTLVEGTKKQFLAEGVFSDDSVLDLTSAASWTSSVGSIATVSMDSGTKGLVSALAEGTTILSATLGAVTGTAEVTVTKVSLTSLSLTPSSATIPIGFSKKLVATAIFSDSSTQDVSESATWTVANSDSGVVSNTVGEKGKFQGSASGVTMVSAHFRGQSATSDITVTPETLNSLTISPSNVTIAVGELFPLTATGIYSGSTTLDLTSAVTWTSSDASEVKVSNLKGRKGEISGVASGSETITATLLGHAATASITVVSMPSIAFSGTSFFEAAGDTGSVDSTRTVTLSDDTFAAVNFVNNVHYTVTGVPSGLILLVTRDSSTQLTLSMSGSALAHANSNDTSSIVLTLNASAFASGFSTPNNNPINLSINFFDASSVPNSPTSFAATVNALAPTTSVDLSWDDMTGDTGGYKIAYKSGGSSPADCNSDTTTTASANATSKTITGLTIATQYTFIICTINTTSGQSAASSGVSVYTTPPIPTTFAAAPANATQINLTWNDMSADTNGYKIAYQSGASAPANCSSGSTTTAAANATGVNVTGLTASTQYSFIVCTSNTSAGDSAATSSISAYTKPLTTTGLTAAAATTTEINLTWNDATDDTNGYKIAYQSGTSAPASCALGSTTTSAADTTTKSISGLLAGTQYSFLICTSSAAAGDSIASPGVSMYTKTAAPTISATVNSSTQITISWSNVTGDTSGYKIAYQQGASAPANCDSGTTTTSASGATSNLLTGLSPSTQYSFIACTVNSSSGQSAASNSATGSTSAADSNPVPGGSGTLTVTPSTTSVVLTWVKATDDVSAQSQLQYEVRRSTTDANVNLSTVGAAESNGFVTNAYATDIATATVSGLTPATTYKFQVVVRDEAGNKSVYTAQQQTTSGACFAEGTPILTNLGTVPIESLEIGDQVLTFDPSTATYVEAPITKLHVYPSILVGLLTISDGRQIYVSEEHPFFSNDKNDWVNAADLKDGENVLDYSSDGNPKPIPIVSYRTLDRRETVYNVTVDTQHTYFANGIFVHNK